MAPTYHTAGLMQFAKLWPYERGNLSPQKCLHRNRKAQILHSILHRRVFSHWRRVSALVGFDGHVDGVWGTGKIQKTRNQSVALHLSLLDCLELSILFWIFTFDDFV